MERFAKLQWMLSLAVGVAIGSMLTMAFGRLDPSGDVLKIYLGAMTVLLGSALGLVGARTMDALADRRKIRRRMLLNFLNIRVLERAFTAVSGAIAEWKDIQKLPDGEEKQDTLASAAHDARIYIGRIGAIARTPPNFEEIIDNESDFEQANEILGSYEYAAYLARKMPNESDSDTVLVEWMEDRVDEIDVGDPDFALARARKLRAATEHFSRFSKDRSSRS